MSYGEGPCQRCGAIFMFGDELDLCPNCANEVAAIKKQQRLDVANELANARGNRKQRRRLAAIKTRKAK